ncbi:MAG: bifunctional diaminohydroxyphosphoribosylaminopyrimidine deaminase/5-amino-6-(5-phosphoribosylamino)uracil reductase RibD [Burkholderiales bacterium]|nr:bifunctional diaminohydroxyphosphoribosylaminopyrimidine deaminase/5-amino-6-(5-phosphoribosylamino)uracil reductase RibD [Burkholderiales bacterium]
MNIENDASGISHALTLAAQGMFITTPNPRVGCVIVKNGQVIGEGYTQPAGQAHAEVQALKDAASRGHDAHEATVYVTLEPCSHFGRTPPCADALINAGVSRVVAAIADPNPLVAGQGLAKLKASGIDVTCGVLEDEAREMNVGFFSRMQRGRPWVRMKVAASLDGRTALHNGQSQWITSEAARADGHWWRARACAILTGSGTVNQDDPQMTVRGIDTPRQPLKIIVDSKLQISPKAKILEGSVLIVAAKPDQEKETILRNCGAEVIYLPNAHGKVDLSALMAELGKRQINELHVEGGFKLNGALIETGCVDELLVYLAPTLLGDAQGMFNLPALNTLEGRRDLQFHEIKQIGVDLRILARFV